MADTPIKNSENMHQENASKKRSFFGGELDLRSKDFIDFRHNTQEEIDKFNQDIEINSQLNDIMDGNTENIISEKEKTDEDTKNYTGEAIEGEVVENPDSSDKVKEYNQNTEDEEQVKAEDEAEAENILDKDLQEIEEPISEITENNIIEETNNTSNTDSQENNKGITNNVTEIKDENNTNKDNEAESDQENDRISEIENNVLEEQNENEENLENETKFFDPFELNIENDENSEDNVEQQDSKMFDPFGLNEEDNSENDEFNNDEDDKNSQNTMFDPFNLSDEDEINSDEDEINNEEQIIEEEVNDEKEINDEEEVTNEEEVTDEKEINDEEEVTNEEEVTDEEEINDEEEVTNEEEVTDEEEVNDEEEVTDEKEINDEEEVTNEEEVTDEEEINDEEEVTNEEKVTDEEEINDEEKDIGYVYIDKGSSIEQQNENKDKSIKKKYTPKGELITDEEIELEQGNDTVTTEDDEEYKPTEEEIFEQEPTFFGDDELSQQFLRLVEISRKIFKMERNDDSQNPYFKILGSKTSDSTLEYLFYLIEEADEPVDLFIKKVVTEQESGEENEHLLQFSYNNKQLDIFVDEIILYEKINKADISSSEYNDTKAILEKFIFLTQTYYDELKDKLNKQQEEKKKKRQLQQIFKGF